MNEELAAIGIRALIVVILASIFGWFMYHQGEAHTQNLWNQERAEAADARIAAIVHRTASNAALAEAQQVTNTSLKKEYLDEIASNRTAGADYDAHSLRLPSTICAGRGPAPATKAAGSGRSDATPAGTGPLPQGTGTDPVGDQGVAIPDDIAARLRALTDEADAVTASCRAAQKFIRDNGLSP